MNKAQLIAAMAESTGLAKVKCEASVNAMIEIISGKMAEGEDVVISKFGKFTRVKCASKVGVNPQTGDKITIPATNRVKFRASEALKEAVKED